MTPRQQFIADAIRTGVVSPRCDDHGMYLAELRDNPLDTRGDVDMIGCTGGKLACLSRYAPGALKAAVQRNRWAA